MRKLEIKKINKFNSYLFEDAENKCNIELILEFYGLDKPTVGDKLLIHEELLNTKSPEFTQPYAFELDKEINSKQVKDLNMKEFVVLRKNNKNYTLKRIYG